VKEAERVYGGQLEVCGTLTRVEATSLTACSTAEARRVGQAAPKSVLLQESDVSPSTLTRSRQPSIVDWDPHSLPVRPGYPLAPKVDPAGR
jgi:hypothetical protein